ncbi:unnamed protein product [Rotaria sp. Silwood2]|nr:unnamed protein product [Rotaria sp. Silwood2]CAF2639237.1 unnamed protein product [Rotaria sp. Silwood2]CAF2972547.1 unnamed protein product [Rotaria sp. Silwood2]CAF3124897.1 unnamed protein product [Rotaria sp. Silwood2]CAF3914278.1 unnamed protein product [Rotaria sp. Silwood2]
MAFTPTNLTDWIRSDTYHNRFLISPDDALTAALKLSEQNRLPSYAVSEAQGKFLNLVAKSIQARRILEIGTLAGYSTIWLANALPDNGELVTCEISEDFAKIAQININNAGLTSKVKIIVGPATATLPDINPHASFDLAFIDADKQSNVEYFIQAKRLVRKGGVIIVDNVVRNGRVADLEQNDPSIEGVRKLLEYIQKDPTVEATTLGTVGEKGYDGFLYAVNKFSID